MHEGLTQISLRRVPPGRSIARDFRGREVKRCRVWHQRRGAARRAAAGASRSTLMGSRKLWAARHWRRQHLLARSLLYTSLQVYHRAIKTTMVKCRWPRRRCMTSPTSTSNLPASRRSRGTASTHWKHHPKDPGTLLIINNCQTTQRHPYHRPPNQTPNRYIWTTSFLK